MFISGRGLFVLLTIPAGFLLGLALFKFAPVLSERSMGKAIVVIVCGVMSAALTWVVGARCNRPQGQFDRATGETFSVRNQHRFFFIPMQWWAFAPLLIIAAWTYKINADYQQHLKDVANHVPVEVANEKGWTIISIEKEGDAPEEWKFQLRDHSLSKVSVKIDQQIGPWKVFGYQEPNLILVNEAGSRMIIPPYKPE